MILWILLEINLISPQPINLLNELEDHSSNFDGVITSINCLKKVKFSDYALLMHACLST
jgi:hypothetical protein